MKNYRGICHIGFGYGLLAAIVLLGCMSTSTPQAVLPSARAIQPSVDLTIQPTKVLNNAPPTATLSGPIPSETSQATVTPSLAGVWEMIEQVDSDRVLSDLRKLTGEEPICNGIGCDSIVNRLTGGEGIQLAKNYIYDELVNLGYTVELRDWSLSGYADQNIIARKPGMSLPGEQVIFVAHLDGIKGSGEERYPAADDNASGVVDLMELGRIISGYSFERSVVLFFSTGEEQGSLGVKSFLSLLSPTEISSIRYVVDVDMVGYDANRDGVMQLWHGDHIPSQALTQAMREIILASEIGLVPELAVGCG